MSYLYTIIISLIVGFAGGYLVCKKNGAKVASDVAKVKTDIADIK